MATRHCKHIPKCAPMLVPVYIFCFTHQHQQWHTLGACPYRHYNKRICILPSACAVVNALTTNSWARTPLVISPLIPNSKDYTAWGQWWGLHRHSQMQACKTSSADSYVHYGYWPDLGSRHTCMHILNHRSSHKGACRANGGRRLLQAMWMVSSMLVQCFSHELHLCWPQPSLAMYLRITDNKTLQDGNGAIMLQPIALERRRKWEYCSLPANTTANGTGLLAGYVLGMPMRGFRLRTEIP